MYKIRNTNKQKILLQSNQRIFSTSDLALLWNVINRHTLLITIQRYIDRNILFRLYKGLYSTLPIRQLNKYEIACATGGPFSYISAETILCQKGILMQDIRKITLFGKKKKELIIGDNTYLCRYLNSKYLLNRAGIDDKKGYSVASTERALADILHINPKFYIDNKLSIDMEKVEILNKEIGYNDSSK